MPKGQVPETPSPDREASSQHVQSSASVTGSQNHGNPCDHAPFSHKAGSLLL